MSNIKCIYCKRDMYLGAWKEIWDREKGNIRNNPDFDGVNPAANKKLATEVNNFCVVAIDESETTELWPDGIPVGVFSFVVTENRGNRKIIGKQFAVAPSHQRQGIGSRMVEKLESKLIEVYDSGVKYYIGCSGRSKGIYESRGLKPFETGNDLYKFNVKLN